MSTMRSMKKMADYVRGRVSGNDPAHDFDHIMRVCKNAKMLAEAEGGNRRLVLTAALLHDIVSYPKSDPRSKNSSSESAEKATRVLKKFGYDEEETGIISDAIRDHSFSRGVVPRSLTGMILQDADRLDAMGSLGIARAFSVGGSEGRRFYSRKDPFCKTRPPDDTRWTLDHFYKKLLILESRMNTHSARKEARRRTRIMRVFLEEMESEI